mmetsp:Transcript_27247/g.38338  ORF Transcript_27247/g.38338 Transcript_27247/m.38338 type:complete len:756 (-) Transcript_27247:159-2426(-)
MLAEIKSNERSSTCISGLALGISHLITESGGANEVKLLVQAKKELNVRSNTVSEAFASVEGKPSKHAKFLAKATEKKSNSGSDNTSSRNLHELEDDIVAKMGTSSGSNALVGTARENLNYLESDVTGMLQDDANKHGGGSNSEVFEDELANIGNANNSSNTNIMVNTNNQISEGYKDPAPEDDNFSDNEDFPPPELQPVTTSARGLAGEPDVEYGQTHENLANTTDDPDGQLAVAVAVVPNEQETLIPAAIEYEPDSKPPLYRNRRFRLYGCLAAVLLLVIVVGVAVGVSMGGNSSSNDENRTGGGTDQLQPTRPPITAAQSAENEALSKIIGTVVGEEKLLAKESPYRKALDWILFDDPLGLTPDSDNIVQRYIVALFYISTTEDTPWLSCNRPKEGEESSCDHPILIQALPDPEYDTIEDFRWLSEEHECEWAGVRCDQDNVIDQINLGGQKIRGTLPEEIAELTQLQSLALWFNDLYGYLPPRLSEMQHLANLELHYNFFEGSIPEEWFTTAWGLQRIILVGNLLTGTLPTSITQLNDMRGFFIQTNELSGTIPTEFGDMSTLQYTRIGENNFEGTLPTELGKMTDLRELWIYGLEEVIGSIPSEVALLEKMADLRLHKNSLTGEIPIEIFRNMKKLNRLDIYDNRLRGTISTEVSKLEKLQQFRIKGNDFTGTIPTELGSLALTSAWFHKNDFVGSMPEEICTLTTGVASFLEYLTSDCLPGLENGDPVLPCDCCSLCCDGYDEAAVCLLQ